MLGGVIVVGFVLFAGLWGGRFRAIAGVCAYYVTRVISRVT